MLYFAFFILGVITLAFGLVPLWFSRRFKQYVEMKLKEPKEPMDTYTPKISMIIPCKGVDFEFEENIGAMLKQAYPYYEVLFVTATEDDRAHEELKRIIGRHKRAPAKLIVAGINPHRGQKITNLLKAVENVSIETEVFVFLDADIRIHKDFLRYLVAPLRKDSVGAATGYPWFIPHKGKLAAVLKSIWGAGAILLMIDPRHNYASGAVNAIRKEVFEKAEIAKALDCAITDTWKITESVKKLGLVIEFVPQCLAISSDNSGFSDTLKWTNRQTIISRVYSPLFWWTVFLTFSFSSAMLLLGIVILTLWIIGKGSFVFPGVLMLSLIPLEMMNVALLLPVVKKMIPEYSKQIEKMKWRYYLITPLAFVLIMINSMVSLTTNEITWRGVRYKLISPTETRLKSD